MKGRGRGRGKRKRGQRKGRTEDIHLHVLNGGEQVMTD